MNQDQLRNFTDANSIYMQNCLLCGEHAVTKWFIIGNEAVELSGD
jgi:hypothetical protein